MSHEFVSFDGKEIGILPLEVMYKINIVTYILGFQNKYRPLFLDGIHQEMCFYL